MKQETINKILQETENGYDLIAEKFSQTRNHFWGDLEFIKNYIKVGDKILDYGCGNGRLLELFSNKLANEKKEYVGIDVSNELVRRAEQRYGSFQNVKFLKINSSQISLAFNSNYFNTVYSIAVFHHLPDGNFRLKVAKELYRILKPEGYIIITVWNLWQKRYRKNVFQNWFNKVKQKSELDWNDCWVTFANNKGDVFNRYHHAFTQGDLKRLFEKAGFEIKKCELTGGNILLIAKKLANIPKSSIIQVVEAG